MIVISRSVCLPSRDYLLSQKFGGESVNIPYFCNAVASLFCASTDHCLTLFRKHAPVPSVTTEFRRIRRRVSIGTVLLTGRDGCETEQQDYRGIRSCYRAQLRGSIILKLAAGKGDGTVSRSVRRMGPLLMLLGKLARNVANTRRPENNGVLACRYTVQRCASRLCRGLSF